MLVPTTLLPPLVNNGETHFMNLLRWHHTGDFAADACSPDGVATRIASERYSATLILRTPRMHTRSSLALRASLFITVRPVPFRVDAIPHRPTPISAFTPYFTFHSRSLLERFALPFVRFAAPFPSFPTERRRRTNPFPFPPPRMFCALLARAFPPTFGARARWRLDDAAGASRSVAAAW